MFCKSLECVLVLGIAAVMASAHGAPRKVNIDLGGGSSGNPTAASTSTAIAAPTEASAAASEETVKVLGRGVGTDEGSALKDAFRDAIERAIGLYVDAETVAKNDEIIKDQILTHSNAYVTHYDQQSAKPTSGGLTEVRILATVKKRPLTQKIQDVMPTQATAVNAAGLQNAFAQMTTKEKRAGDAAALLENALSGLNPVKSLLVANVRPETQKIITADGNTTKRGSHGNAGLSADQVALRYLFELRLDREKYFKEFVPNLKRVLEQISLLEPKEIRISEAIPPDRMNAYRYADVLAEYKNDIQVRHKMPQINGQRWPGWLHDSWGPLDAIHVYGGVWGSGYKEWDFGPGFISSQGNRTQRFWLTYGGYGKVAEAIDVALITELTPDLKAGKIILYELDKSCLEIWNRWMEDVIGEGRGKRATKRQILQSRSTFYNIVIGDGQGQMLSMMPWEVLTSNLMNVKFASQGEHVNRDYQDKCHVYITPFVGCFGECYIEWKSLIVDKSLLPKIKQIKIELAQ